ncbi:DnaJ-domain-containing protein [Exidia glandulosa HHB12029]|uniref:DnaJ-domain-containing protein n=1 Tax=Exidia glandulosa HHB12029 TaxID=1314781 RepID=A0A166AMC3_EXIGL|nr:DnaJ-domain-containing protein [Exidia glandulosa HHB12029]KZV94026.1 DnaJ-domain-containing protein [Exidia glandulosa HHB12029]
MDDADPISQFFPGEEDVDLYAVLALTNAATGDDIRKAYRKLALVHHPDKHAKASEERQAEASRKFQQIGFAYAVLSDDKRRKRYDATGRTDDAVELAAGEDGWEAYFSELFDSVTRSKLDEMKKEYQGSEEERADLLAAYNDCEGDIEEIMTYIPHSTYEDEDRLVAVLRDMINDGSAPLQPKWKASTGDKKAKARRRKDGEKEAKEAEALAKEIGVWDEFYGSGKTGKRKAKGKKDAADAGDDGDVSALQALIQQRQKQRMGALVDSLAAKYGAMDDEPPTPKGKKAGAKRKRAAEPELDDAEFERLQGELFGDKKTAKSRSRR